MHYLVMRLTETFNVSMGGRLVEVDAKEESTGVRGYLPVFDDYDKAKAFAKGAEIKEIVY